MKFTAILLLLFLSQRALAVVDTLQTTAGDQLIVTYNVAVNGSTVKIDFVNARKLLNKNNRKKYSELKEVVPVFFDGNGGNGVEFHGKPTSKFQVPAGVTYKRSADGFFLIHEEAMPSLTFDVGKKTDAVLSIPVYLAHYEKRKKYNVFAKCNDLQIPLKAPATSAGGGQGTSQNGKKIVGYREEVGYEEEIVDDGGGQSYVEGGGALSDEMGGGAGGGMSPDEEAKILMERIEQLMPLETGNTLSENIMGSINQLNALSSKISDPELRAKANQTLSDGYGKKAQLEQAAQDKEKAKNDSIAAEQKAEADKAQSRNLWMIIGGIALAILGFVGNQVMQHFRSLKNLKNMEAMQANAMKKAEDEAKKRTEEAIKKQTQKATEAVEQKVKGSAAPLGKNAAAVAAARAVKNNNNANQPNNPNSPNRPNNPNSPNRPSSSTASNQPKTITIGGKTYQVKQKSNRGDQPNMGNRDKNNKDIKI